jgi:outer membrane protein
MRPQNNNRQIVGNGAVVGWCVLLATALTVPTKASAQIRQITLDQATQMAIRANPSVVQARGAVGVAEAARLEQLGRWLPNITGSSAMSANSSTRFNENTQTTVVGASTQYSAGLSASLVVFDGLRRNAQGRSTTANLASANADLISQEFNVTLQTKQAFFNALAAEELVRVSETRINSVQEQLRQTRDRLAAGTAIRSDTLRSFVALGNAQLQLLTAQTQRANAIASLSRLIGLDEPVQPVADSSLLMMAPLDTAALRTEAFQNSPTVLAAIASAKAADAQMGVNRAQYFPTVTASYSQNLAGPQISTLNQSWSARLNLSWPLFNGFSRETAMERSRAAQTTADAQAEDARRQVDAQLTQQFALLEAAMVRHQIAVASELAANEDLRVQQQRYDVGASTIIEVLASRVNVDQAAVDRVQARLDYLLAKAQIEAIIGHEL